MPRSAPLCTTADPAALLRGLRSALLTLLAGAAVWAHAQTDDVTPRSAAQTLGCVQKPADSMAVPAQPLNDGDSGMVRLKLRFETPDAPPTVEVLATTARSEVQRQARLYVAEYRLPCLQPQDGAVEAVQEFAFMGKPVSVLRQSPLVPLTSPLKPAALCLVRPQLDMAPLPSTTRALQHVVFTLHFQGDGTQPPQVRIAYSTAPRWVEERMSDWVQGFRMPCRQAGDTPMVVQRHFVLGNTDVRRYALSKSLLGLAEFLGMTEQPAALRAWFDFNTMGCPFKVAYRMYGPHLPNVVLAQGPANPNRTLFLQWLRERQVHFANAQQASDLFGRAAVIQVPCGVLDLRESADATAPLSDSPQSSLPFQETFL